MILALTALNRLTILALKSGLRCRFKVIRLFEGGAATSRCMVVSKTRNVNKMAPIDEVQVRIPPQ